MKHSQIQLAILAICGSLALTACGGGSSNPTIGGRLQLISTPTTPSNKAQSNQTPKPTTPIAENKPDESQPPAADNQPAESKPPVADNQPTESKPPVVDNQPAEPKPPVAENKAGNGLQAATNILDVSDIKSVNADTLNTLMVDGKSFDLSGGKNYAFNDMGNVIVGGTFAEHMKFGVTKDEKPTAFVQGDLTPIDQLPTSTQITYVGRAIVGTNPNFSSIVVADFPDKRLAGYIAQDDPDLNSPNDRKYQFEATINRNTFEGQNVKGAFYGPKAVEVGGIHTTVDGKTAVFGGNQTLSLPPRNE